MERINEDLLRVDICNRLPFGLKGKYQWGDSDICNIVGMTKNEFSGELDQVIENPKTLEMESSSVSVGAIPILYPWETLTQEITLYGNFFIPLVEWAKITWPKDYPELKEIKLIKGNFVNSICQEIGYFRQSHPHDLLESILGIYYLNKWMIDYRDLINKGLAISAIRNISKPGQEYCDENPYR